MDERWMSEHDAFTFIQRTAMSERIEDAGGRRPHRRRLAAAVGSTSGMSEAAAARRQLADLPRVLRAARGHGDRQRAGHERRVRVHVDVHLRAQGPAARRRCWSPSTGRSRRSATRPTRRTRPNARRRPTSCASRWGSCARCSTALGVPADRAGRLGGRRPHRHGGRAGRRARRRGGHRHRRP